MYKPRKGDRIIVRHPTTEEDKEYCARAGYSDWEKVPNGSIGTVIWAHNKLCSVAFDKKFKGAYGSRDDEDNEYPYTWNICSILLQPLEPVSIQKLVIEKIKYLDQKWKDRKCATNT